MHAILMTFNPEVSEEEFAAAFGPKLKASRNSEGLVMKTFLDVDDKTWGAFFLFTSRESADAYLTSDFFEEFSSSALVSNVRVRHFGVDDGPSMAFGTPTRPLAEATQS